MLKIYIHGIEDGLHSINLSAPIEEIDDINPEFFGDVLFEGKMRKVNKRFTITGKISCKAKLICDLSLEEFVEELNFEFSTSVLADTNIYMIKKASGKSGADDKEIVIHEDDKYIDLTSEIKEELIVHLPMKRVAPQYRDKDFEDIYPQYSANPDKKPKSRTKEIDDRWSNLTKLKLN